MKALDTNILVRFLLNDDTAQAERVLKLFRDAEQNEERFFVSILVLLEMIWVLGSVYEIARDDLINAIENVLSMPIIEVEKAEAVFRALLEAKKSNLDLADLLIAFCSKAAGAEAVITFDKRAAKHQLFIEL